MFYNTCVLFKHLESEEMSSELEGGGGDFLQNDKENSKDKNFTIYIYIFSRKVSHKCLQFHLLFFLYMQCKIRRKQLVY